MIVELQAEIERRMRRGARFDEIEDHVIDPAPLSDDQKAALWLFAWSYWTMKRTSDVESPWFGSEAETLKRERMSCRPLPAPEPTKRRCRWKIPPASLRRGFPLERRKSLSFAVQ